MAASRPTSITVGPLDWTIDYDTAALAVADRDDNEHRIGSTEHHKLLIRIAGDMPEPAVRATLTHELIHATIQTAGPELDDDLEERLAVTLGATLLDTLRRNPALVAYLTA